MIVDLDNMRRHYAQFRKAWDHGANELAPRESPTAMTVAAVLAAEDLGTLLGLLDSEGWSLMRTDAPPALPDVANPAPPPGADQSPLPPSDGD